MDLALFFRSIGRHKIIFVVGLIAACALAVLATAKVSLVGGKPQLTYRSPVLYSATTRLVVTQHGFPWGLAVLPQSGTDASDYGDPGRFSTLAGFYAMLANSDIVRTELHLDPRKAEAVAATAVVQSGSGATLPFLDLVGYATDPADAAAVSVHAAGVLRTYVDKQQQAADLPVKQRAVLRVIQVPNKVAVAVKRKKTLPIVVFMTVLLATIGLILVLENIARSREERQAVEDGIGGEVADLVAHGHRQGDVVAR